LDIPCYFLENIFVLIRCSISANAPRSHGFGYGILEPSSLNTRRFCSDCRNHCLEREALSANVRSCLDRHQSGIVPSSRDRCA
jgi:hypothetical protein